MILSMILNIVGPPLNPSRGEDFVSLLERGLRGVLFER
jgi:hypothetical protein